MVSDWWPLSTWIPGNVLKDFLLSTSAVRRTSSVCEGYCASGTAHLPAQNFRPFDIWNLRFFAFGVPDFGLFALLFLRCVTYGLWCYCVEGMLLPGLCFLGWYQGFCVRTCPRGPCVSSPEEAFMGGRMSWQAVWDGIRYFSKCKV